MLKVKRLFKSVISIILIFTVCIIGATVTVYADPDSSSGTDYSKRATAMINFFHNKNSGVEVSDISAEEFRVFGVFLSNFILPLNTDLSEIDTTLTTDNNADLTSNHNAWELFCDAFGKDKDEELLQKLLSAYKSVINETIGDDSKLYYYKDGTKATATVGTIFNWYSLANDGQIFYTVADGEKKAVFSTKNDVGKVAFLLSIGTSMGVVSDSNDISECHVYVTPFGDIVYKTDDDKVRVIVPACLNPYTYSESGDKLYINNSFAMGCLISENDAAVRFETGEITDDDRYKYYCLGYREETDSFGVCREYSVLGDVYNFLKCGNYSSNFYSVDDLMYLRFKDSNGEDIRMSLWTLDTLRRNCDNSGSSAIGLVNVNKGVLNNVSSTLKSEADKYTRGIWNNSAEAESFWTTKENFSDVKEIVASYSEVEKEFNSYVSIFTNIYSSNDAKSAAGWSWITNDSDKYDQLVYFQIPIDETVSKIAVFSEEGFSDKAWSSDSTLSYVKDSYIFTSTDKVSDSLSEIVDMQGSCKDDKGYNDSTYVKETLTCLNKTLSSLFKANSYIKNSGKIADSVNLWAGIYWAYLEDLAGLSISGSDIKFGSVPSFDWLPELNVPDFKGNLQYLIDSSGSESDNTEISEKQNNIISWTYDILNSDDINNKTRVNWLKSIVDGLFISMHNSMVGVDITGSITSVGNADASGVHHSVMGYVTTPTFSEMPVTNWIMDNYTIIYLILMLIISVIMVIMVMSRTRKIGSAVFTFVMMLFILLLPVELLNGGILISNNVAEDIFGSKFTYWAIVQHAEYIDNKNEVETSSNSTSDSDQAISNVSAGVDNLTSSQQLSDNGITVKWLSPKKYGLTEKIQSQAQDTNNLSLFTYFTEELFKGETYSADENSTYLYRTYYSIYSSAKSGYDDISKETVTNSKGKTATISDLSAVIRSEWLGKSDSVATSCNWNSEQISNFTKNSVPLTNALLKTKRSVVEDRMTADGNGMILRPVIGGTYLNSAGKNVTYPSGYTDSYIDSDIMNETRNEYKSTNRISVILTDTTLNKVVLNFVNYTTDNKGLDLGTSPTATSSENEQNCKDISSGVNEFLLYTESPYYYFYNVFSDVLVDNGSTKGSDDFVRVILSEDFFKVVDEDNSAYGEFKDYLDFEGLFTYIIPYLNYANSDVKQYERTFGMTVDRSDFSGVNAEDQYNLMCQNLQNVWNLYSPWVDALYEANSSSQDARSGYDIVSIDDPLNPSSYYYKSRPMTFSQAQAKLRGYAESDLTDVECKLQNVLKNTYDDIIELLNYKDLASMENGSDILISAAAMMATFNFNQEFSDTSFLSDGVTLYPLSYELRNMNYDCFLRLILANSTYTLTSSTMDSTGLYSNLIHNTSFVTGLLLILVDFVAVYLIPAFKILLMIVMLLLGLSMSISCALSKPDKLTKTIVTSFILPLIGTVGILILHTLLISLFMGNGVTGVIEYRGLSLSVGDPTITLLLLLIVDSVTLLLLFMLFKKTGKDLIKYIKTVFEFTKGVTIGAAGALISGAVGSLKGVAHYGLGVPANHIAAKVSRYKDSKSAANAMDKMLQGRETSGSTASSGSSRHNENSKASQSKPSNGGTSKSTKQQRSNGGNRSHSTTNTSDKPSNKRNSTSPVRVKVTNVDKVKPNINSSRLNPTRSMSGNRNYDSKPKSTPVSNSKSKGTVVKLKVRKNESGNSKTFKSNGKNNK